MKKLLFAIIAICFSGIIQAQSINDSLLLYLPFNGNANDASGNDNNGIIHGAMLTTGRTDAVNRAYSFNGTDAYIEIPASPSLSKIYTSGEVTIAAWINIHSWYNNWNVFSVFEQYDPATDYGSILLEANWFSGGILFESGYNTNYIDCDYNWDFDRWHHLAVTYSNDTNSVKFYVDGVLISSKPYQEGFTPDNTNSYTIGRSLSGPDEYSNGKIDEVRIYNRALQDAEIMALTNISTPLGVTLGPVTATIKNNALLVDFSSLSEKNNDRFIIEAATDGMSFKEIGIVKSAVVNSDTPVYYHFSLDTAKMNLAGTGCLGLFIIASLIYQRNRRLFAVLAAVSVIMFISCEKAADEVPASSISNVYIRITQVDTDGTKTHSKIVKAIYEP